MEQYKIIDGVVYKAIDAAEIRNKMVAMCDKVKPYLDGIVEAQRCIKAYQEQINSYNKQVEGIVSAEAIDAEVAKLVDADRAGMLGFH